MVTIFAATTVTATDTSDFWTDFGALLIQFGQVAGAIAAIGGVIWIAFKYGILKPLDRKIFEATKQIQPGANGGQSLTDVNKKVDKLAEAVNSMLNRIEEIDNRSLKIYDHMIGLEKITEEHDKIIEKVKRTRRKPPQTP